ncbi:MAG: hypothetical protein CMJ83_14095 [Planctomycetes bacterium]|nr:hypothetical protein [Planctomycetota bacterium]
MNARGLTCVGGLLWVLVGCASPTEAVVNDVGPVVGHVDKTSARILFRRGEAGDVHLTVTTPAGAVVVRSQATAEPGSDLTVSLDVPGLTAGTAYAYTVVAGDRSYSGTFRTAPTDSRRKVRLAFGSCANDRVYADSRSFTAIRERKPDALVLLGDTPYIDSTKLKIQRRRYREFWSWPSARPLFANVPTWGTWDDHDFGRNDTVGKLKFKERSRQAFLEYHAHASFGERDEGIYTRFRWGPIEVWLLDTRWFGGLEPSPFDPKKTSLLGAAQLAWLQRSLKTSDATFKMLACGMIWNGAVRPLKRDHWGTWAHERDGLFRWIGEQRISGVVLMGGDIHRSRALRHPTRASAGYPITELITSPLANSTISLAKQPSPWLLHDAAERETWMEVDVDGTADDPTLEATCRTSDGRTLFRVAVKASQLARAR